MQNDLNHRSSEVAKKWQFDFSIEHPLQKPALNNGMSWEPIEQTVAQTTRPRVQLKPRMNIANLVNKDCGFTQLFQGNTDNRSSVLFGSSVNTDSTVADSMLSGSIVGSVGKGSIVDFNMSNIGRRTSIAVNMQRRQTVQPTIARQSDSSLNDRGSAIGEGHVNHINSAINSGKHFSEVGQEEFKTSVEAVGNGQCDSQRSGSGSGRKHMGIRSFVNDCDREDGPSPFKSGAIQAPEQLNNADEDDDCNAEDIDEGCSSGVFDKSILTGTENKIPAAFSLSFK